MIFWPYYIFTVNSKSVGSAGYGKTGYGSVNNGYGNVPSYKGICLFIYLFCILVANIKTLFRPISNDNQQKTVKKNPQQIYWQLL